jgi:hypothetical protein
VADFAHALIRFKHLLLVGGGSLFNLDLAGCMEAMETLPSVRLEVLRIYVAGKPYCLALVHNS